MIKLIFSKINNFRKNLCKNIVTLVYKIIDSNTTLYIKKLSEDSQIPLKADNGSAGFDLYSTETIVIPKDKRILIPTGIATSIPVNYYLRIAPRSGLSYKNYIDVGAGVIDSSYRGEIKVLLINNGADSFTVNKGDRIAQLIMERCANPKISVVESLDDTDRGDGGFGHSGGWHIISN